VVVVKDLSSGSEAKVPLAAIVGGYFDGMAG